MGAGVIDIDYGGEIEAVLFNHGTKNFIVKKGDRIAQLILKRYETPQIIEIEIFSTPDTSRGSNGFGSTGTAEMKTAASADIVIDKQEVERNQPTTCLTAKYITTGEETIPIDEPLRTVLSNGAKGIAYIFAMILRHTARRDGI